MPHDDSKTCEGLFGPLGGRHLMAPVLLGLNRTAPWSPCSALYVTEFFDNGHGGKRLGGRHDARANQKRLRTVCVPAHLRVDSLCPLSHTWTLSCPPPPPPPQPEATASVGEMCSAVCVCVYQLRWEVIPIS